MPKTDIDYSNTIIYKITCKDPEIKDVYVGHTTNFVQRKHAHKQGCNNPKSANYDCKLYNTMRERGGWTNWKMEIINFFNCNDHYEARQKEQEYFVSLNANLNSIEPMPKPKETIIKPVKVKKLFICDLCNVNCHTMKGLETHNETNKHKKQTIKLVDNETSIIPIEICSANSVSQIINVNEVCVMNDANYKTPINASKFDCNLCDYKCSKQSDWLRHIARPKHQKNENGINKTPKNADCLCSCGKVYKHSTGLWRHKKTCNYIPEAEQPNISDMKTLTTLVLDVVKSNTDLQKQNHELQKQMIDICKNMGNNACL